MTATLKIIRSATSKDMSFGSTDETIPIVDAVATSHDIVDRTPRVISTAGLVGALFSTLETPVKQVERMICEFVAGADVIVRIGGAAAFVLGILTSAPSVVGGEQIVLNVDGVGNVTTTLVAGDTTITKVAQRINYFHNAQIASVDTTGVLRLSGALTGGRNALDLGRAYGSVVVVSGSGLALVGLTAGTTYGAGDDVRVGPGVLEHNHPAASLPRKVELSGTATASRFIVAGKAS